MEREMARTDDPPASDPDDNPFGSPDDPATPLRRAHAPPGTTCPHCSSPEVYDVVEDGRECGACEAYWRHNDNGTWTTTS